MLNILSYCGNLFLLSRLCLIYCWEGFEPDWMEFILPAHTKHSPEKAKVRAQIRQKFRGEKLQLLPNDLLVFMLAKRLNNKTFRLL